MNRSWTRIVPFFVLAVLPYQSAEARSRAESLEELGRELFFDRNLSFNRTQSCATCHDPANGFVDARVSRANGAASLGDDGRSFGDRSAPAIAYASLTPRFHLDETSGEFVGGQFWDGRAAGLSEQAAGPPLNPIEMGMPDKQAVVNRLLEDGGYREAFPRLFGERVLADAEKAYDSMTKAIAAFEKTDFFAPFDSKYDRYLAGEAQLTDLEELGLALFFSGSNTSCSNCHVEKAEGRAREPFTNHEYRNIGVPVNEALRRLNGSPPDRIDQGLLDHPDVEDRALMGRFKIPTLRNVAVTGPYMHNGVFADLRTVVEFYDQFNNSQRTNNPETGKPWKRGEVPETVNMHDLRAKRLSDRQVDALVAFLKTLTDRRFEPLLEAVP